MARFPRNTPPDARHRRLSCLATFLARGQARIARRFTRCPRWLQRTLLLSFCLLLALSSGRQLLRAAWPGDSIHPLPLPELPVPVPADRLTLPESYCPPL